MLIVFSDLMRKNYIETIRTLGGFETTERTNAYLQC